MEYHEIFYGPFKMVLQLKTVVKDGKPMIHDPTAQKSEYSPFYYLLLFQTAAV